MSRNARDLSRAFLKDLVRPTIDFSRTDQSLGIQPPPLEKPSDPDAECICLKEPSARCSAVGQSDIASLIATRSSQRQFADEALSLDELGFLLWATQGVTLVVDAATAFRTVPSAGCRHALETYLAVSNVDGLDIGVYRYLPVSHRLLLESRQDDLAARLTQGAARQSFVGSAPVTFIWTAIPYRMEWCYGLAAHKAIVLDAGHVCQNLYLAAGAIHAGTCAVGAYDQRLMDELLGVDGDEEFTVYLAPVGKLVSSHLSLARTRHASWGAM